MDFNATLIGEMIAFAILIWFCVHFIWPHLTKAIEERQLKIAEGLNAAERAHAELREADNKAAAEVKQARQQAAEIIDRAQQQANQILDKARAAVEAAIERPTPGFPCHVERHVGGITCEGPRGEHHPGVLLCGRVGRQRPRRLDPLDRLED